MSSERRRDARVRPPGQVRMEASNGARPIRGSLLDVSAGGLRLLLEEGQLSRGATVRLEIHLDHPRRPEDPAVLVLDGSGRVVWLRCDDGGEMAGVCFDHPVQLRAAFPDLPLF